MLSISLKDSKGQEKGKIDLKEEIFAVSGSKSVLFDVVKMQLNNQRHGTACTKNRAEVNKSGKKPWKQKGTGRARAGSAGSPVWRGGGVVFGPRPRDYSYKLPPKVNRLAIKLALTGKLKSNDLIILESIDIKEAKTKVFKEILKNLQLSDNKLLFVLSDKNENIIKSARNLSNIKTLTAAGINVYDILNNDKVVITKEALNKMQEALI